METREVSWLIFYFVWPSNIEAFSRNSTTCSNEQIRVECSKVQGETYQWNRFLKKYFDAKQVVYSMLSCLFICSQVFICDKK